MPRAPNEKVAEAEKMFNNGKPMVEIAEKLGIPAGTVRSWKNRYGWGNRKDSSERNVAKKGCNKNATLRKRKKGGQPGNKNAKGGSGNPNPNPPPDMTKHGGYVPVIMDALDDEERELFDSIPDDEELLLLEEIRACSIRERRLLKAINTFRETKGDVAVADVTRNENKRSFKDKEEEAEYDRRQKEKVAKEELLPGKPYSISTHTTNKYLIMARLEQELSSVQNKKTKMIEVLYKLRMEKAKMDSESAGDAVVDDWIEMATK